MYFHVFCPTERLSISLQELRSSLAQFSILLCSHLEHGHRKKTAHLSSNFIYLIFINFFSRVSIRCCIEDILPLILSRLIWIVSMSLSWSCFNLSEPIIKFSELFSVPFCFDAWNIFRLSVTDLWQADLLSFLSVSNIF